jgi:hypothetical protein
LRCDGLEGPTVLKELHLTYLVHKLAGQLQVDGALESSPRVRTYVPDATITHGSTRYLVHFVSGDGSPIDSMMRQEAVTVVHDLLPQQFPRATSAL